LVYIAFFFKETTFFFYNISSSPCLLRLQTFISRQGFSFLFPLLFFRRRWRFPVSSMENKTEKENIFLGQSWTYMEERHVSQQKTFSWERKKILSKIYFNFNFLFIVTYKSEPYNLYLDFDIVFLTCKLFFKKTGSISNSNCVSFIYKVSRFPRRKLP